MPRARHRRVRVYQKLRTAHLERARVQTPASLLFVERRYDFDETLAEGLDLIQAGTFMAPLTIARSHIDTIEINEPLVRIGVVRTALSVGAARLSAALRGEPVRVVAYAIENRDPFAVTGAGRKSAKAALRTAVEDRLIRWVAGQVDRLAFGTQAAERLYRRVLPGQLSGVQSELIPAVPSPCGCSGPAEPVDASVLYLGAFTARKGLPQLIAAWPTVLSQVPHATLTLVGKGPLTDAARAFAQAVPGVRIVHDPPRAEIHRALRAAPTLVLLSQPTATWREQVGLPIVEGLAHGCRIVTTNQTGLADWLDDHGHTVLAPDATMDDTAAAVIAAIAARRPPDDVIADLPEVDGRLAADSWLFQHAGRHVSV